MEDDQRDELEVSDLKLLSSFPIEETDTMEEILGSLWNGMTLAGGNSFSNENWNDEVNGGWEDRFEVSELRRMTSVLEGEICEIDEDLGSEVEGNTCEIDRCLDSEVEGIEETSYSPSDEMMCVNEEETCSGWRAGMVICFSFKAL